MSEAIDLSVFVFVIGYAIIAAVHVALAPLGLKLGLKIGHRITAFFLLALIAKFAILQPPLVEIGFSLLIGILALVAGILMFAKGWIGGGVAKAFPIFLAFLGPDWTVVTLKWVVLIIGMGLIGQLFVLVITRKNRKEVPAQPHAIRNPRSSFSTRQQPRRVR